VFVSFFIILAVVNVVIAGTEELLQEVKSYCSVVCGSISQKKSWFCDSSCLVMLILLFQ